MKTLSLIQPWAYAIVHLGKRIENRSWPTRYRGPILLHAAKTYRRSEYEAAADFVRKVGGPLPLRRHIPFGGIVGRARVVDVIAPDDEDLPNMSDAETERFYRLAPGAMRWWFREEYGWLLADVEPLSFRPCRGALGLFECEAAP